ncbi:MAG: phage head closure protein [Candidatus Lariskella arthropodorum]
MLQPKFCKLNKRIILESYHEKYDDMYESFKPNCAFRYKIWANITPIGFKETYQFGRVEQKYSHQILTRYIKLPNLRIMAIYQQRIFHVLYYIDYQENKKFLTLFVEEVL